MSKTVNAKSSFKEIAAKIRRQAREVASAAGCKVSVRSTWRRGRVIHVSITHTNRNPLCATFRKFQISFPKLTRHDFPTTRDVNLNAVHFEQWAADLHASLENIADPFKTEDSHLNIWIEWDLSLIKDAQNEIDARVQR